MNNKPTSIPYVPAPLSLVATMQIEAAAAAGAEAGGAMALPRFRMVAYTGGPMKVGGWRGQVIVDLAGLSIPSQNRPIRFGHDADAGVGHTDMIRVENGQLVATGVVSRDTAAAREIVASGKNGFPWQASLGASVEEFEFIKSNEKVTVNGRSFNGPVNVVRRATLGEISFVDLGADDATSAKVAASRPQQETNVMAPPLTNTLDAAPESSTAAAPAPVIQAATPALTTADIRAEALAETNRVAAIRTLCSPSAPGERHFADIEAQAISEGWDGTKTALAVLRAKRPIVSQPGAMQGGGGGGMGGMGGGMGGGPLGFSLAAPGPVNQAMLEAACFLSAGFAQPEKHCDAQVLEAADKRFRNGIGLQELFLEAARANGYHGHSFRSDPRTIMRMAFASQDQVMAGWSTVDIGGILSNVANKSLLEGFFSVERVWRNICAIRNVNDFKTVTSYRLIGTDQYEKVAPGGELKHGTLGNETYTNKADTYGLMLSIDRRDTINDDLGAITTVPRKLGRGSGLKINDVFWTIFLANIAFFTVANKNLLAGADTILNIDGLSKAETAFLDQVDSDGKPIGIMPSVMLVPTSLSAIGTQLYKSLELRDTTANNKYPIGNPHQGKYRVEVSRYLGNSKYAGNSQKAWYLLADPNDLPLIEVAFLNGQESPTIETAEANFNVLGVEMRGYHDFGCALQDPRAGVRSKGEA
ncbi:MAG: hypothetical protein FWD61_03860 [Phycisphaerales bacterium]|nr:hypothetical protein [Phycisphaerales bacterium]